MKRESDPMISHVLKTRLYKPKVNGTVVERQQLIDKFNAGKEQSLSLVVAPTGYGKSFIVSNWLETIASKYCWLTIDEELNDFSLFLSHLIYGLKSQFEGAFDGIQQLLDDQHEHAAFETMASLILNELDELDEEIILVLDDYHWIRNQKINGLISKILKYPPEKLHMVIISRWDPTLQLSSHRTFGLVNDIRRADLSFDLHEVEKFADKMLEESLSAEECQLLLDKTEGWAVGLKLALCDLKDCHKSDMCDLNGQDVKAAVKKFKLNQSFFRDYVLKELFDNQPDTVKTFLLTAVIAPRFNKDLLRVVLQGLEGSTSAPEIDFDSFDNIVKTWQFVIPLDAYGEWYRFHQIIHDFLVFQREKLLSKEHICKTHQRAALYFESVGQMETAIRQAVLADDIDLTGELFSRNKYHFLNDEKIKQVCRWIKLVPVDWIGQNIELLLTRAFLREQYNEVEGMQDDLDLCEVVLRQLKDDHPHLNRYWGEYYTGMAILFYTTGNIDLAIEYSKKAQRLLRPYPGYIKNSGLAYLAMALQTKGQNTRALRLIDRHLDSLAHSNYKGHVQLLLIRSIVCSKEGDLTNLFSSASKLKQMSQTYGLQASFIQANYFLFSMYYRKSELTKAFNLLNDFDDTIYLGWPFMIVNFLFLKGFAYNAKGDLWGFNQTMIQIDDFAAQVETENLEPLINAFRVEIALMRGDYCKAVELSKEADFEPYQPFGYYYIPQLTRIRLHIYSGEKEQQLEALSALNKLDDIGRAFNNNILITKSLALKAVLLTLLGDNDKASIVLEEALCIAEQHDYIRSFLDLGELMHSLLVGLLQKRLNDAFLLKIENAFHPEKEIYHKFENLKPADEEKRVHTLNLSKRETEIIGLLSKDFQNKDIANELFVTNEAVKKSLYRLYQKLEVNNRSNAIVKAMKLGLVSP